MSISVKPTMSSFRCFDCASVVERPGTRKKCQQSQLGQLNHCTTPNVLSMLVHEPERKYNVQCTKAYYDSHFR